MDPMTAALLLQGAAAIPNFFGARKRQRAEDERRRQIMKFASPQYLQDLTRQLYGQFMSSPAYSQAQRGIFNAGTNTANQLAGSLAARGLSTSGIGAIAPGLASSAMAGQLGHLRAQGYNAAGQQAAGAQARQLAAFQGLGEQPDYIGQALGGQLGDLSSLFSYMQPKQQPQMSNAYAPYYRRG